MNETLRYTQLGLAVAALLDKEEPLDAGQAQQYIEDGSLFSWLGRRYDGEIDLSLYERLGHINSLYRPVSGHTGSSPARWLPPAPGDRRFELPLPS
jgi:hypothetical protein